MKMSLLNTKVSVLKAQTITILVLPLLSILNFIFVMHLGRPSTYFPNSTVENYLILYLIKIIFQIIFALISVWFLYIFYFNSKSKFISVKWYLKLGIILIILFYNMPTVYTFSLIPQYAQGIKVTNLNEFSLFTKRFEYGRRSVSYSYRNFIKIGNNEYEISDSLFNKLTCPKGDKHTLWNKTCSKSYEFYYLEFEEGLLELKEK